LLEFVTELPKICLVSVWELNSFLWTKLVPTGPAYIDLPGDILRGRVAAANIEYGPTVPLPPPITLPTEAGNNAIHNAIFKFAPFFKE
jgi:hypothetical protein